MVSLKALDSYEGIIDGLFAMAYHHNTEVRGAGIGASEYTLIRFGWLVFYFKKRLEMVTGSRICYH